MEGIGEDSEKSRVDAFISVTSASRDEALFFLESHNFELEPAIHSFYENAAAAPSVGVSDLNQDQYLEEEEDPPAQPRRLFRPPIVSAMSSREEEKKKKAAGGGSSSRRGGIRTLADLNRRPEPGSGSDTDEPQEYYTGGEKSGMLVQDPTRGSHDVEALFERARQMGAMDGPAPQQPSSSSRSFSGTGRLLSGETVPAAPRAPETITYNIYFWTNGFSIDDGPLRRFDDPANAPLLESIRMSECPKELEPNDRLTMVNVNLVRKQEDYPLQEPVRRQTAFLGVGRTLGGGSSTESVGQQPTVAVASAPSVAAAPVVVDDSRPTTSIQLRLADGLRTVARFNTDHTVADIRSFIDNHARSNGRAGPSTYTLQTVGFPPRQLTDTTQTIEQAGLANSVVIQKL